MSDTLTDIVMRQTDYTKEQAIEKLEIYNNIIEDVIKDYMGIVDKKDTTKKSVNQQIYKEIRCMMDDASMKYEKGKREQDTGTSKDVE